MTILKVLYYFFGSAFTFKYRAVSIELKDKEGKSPTVILWGVATEEGWEAIMGGSV